MFASPLLMTVSLAMAPITELPTLFWGIAPEVATTDVANVRTKHDRAVVLVHGLLPRVFHPVRAEKPEAHEWQASSGSLVKQLADDFDVYGFSYGQTQSVDSVAMSRGLRNGISNLKDAGYKEIVLVGHSAGGVIVREFAEMFPDSGITKVVTVAGPHLGSFWAKLPNFTLPKSQVPFIQSMLPETREARTKRATVELKKDLEFCCVLCRTARTDNDTVVSLRSQWPDDLQEQGVSAVLVGCTHFDAMTSEAPINAIVEVVRGKVVRWKPEQIEDARRVLFGEIKKK